MRPCTFKCLSQLEYILSHTAYIFRACVKLGKNKLKAIVRVVCALRRWRIIRHSGPISTEQCTAILAYTISCFQINFFLHGGSGLEGKRNKFVFHGSSGLPIRKLLRLNLDLIQTLSQSNCSEFLLFLLLKSKLRLVFNNFDPEPLEKYPFFFFGQKNEKRNVFTSPK